MMMAKAKAGKLRPESEEDVSTRGVRAWRADRLLELGFSVPQTLLLVHRNDVVHDATKLIERGCDPRTAMKILL